MFFHNLLIVINRAGLLVGSIHNLNQAARILALLKIEVPFLIGLILFCFPQAYLLVDIFKYMYGGPKSVKEQLEYADTIFMQINRVADIASQPDLNLTQLSISVDILASMVSFIKKIDYTSKGNKSRNQRYEECLSAFEDILTILNNSGLLFKYKIKGHIGQENK